MECPARHPRLDLAAIRVASDVGNDVGRGEWEPERWPGKLLFEGRKVRDVTNADRSTQTVPDVTAGE